MKLLKNSALSLEILLAHKVRTALSVTGIVVGVAAVILMVSAGRGAQKEITDRIDGMGTNLIVVSAGQTTVVAGRQRQIDIVRTLLVSDTEAIARECPSVSRAAAAISRKTQARWEGENVSTTVAAMDAEGFEIRNMTIASGRAFDPEEGRAAMRLAILGPTAEIGRAHV
jgi:putative ABC transport system permease protein